VLDKLAGSQDVSARGSVSTTSGEQRVWRLNLDGHHG
jgi:hypothetical protein